MKRDTAETLCHASIVLFPRSTWGSPVQRRLGSQASPEQHAGPSRSARHSRKPARQEATGYQSATRSGMLDPAQALPHLGVQTQPNQGCPPRGTRKPTFTSNRAWSRGARTRGTNRLAAPNGRDCLTSVTSQNWRGARPLPPPAPLALRVPPTRHCAANQKAKSSRAPVGAGQGGGRARQGRGVGWPGPSCSAPGCCVVLSEGRTRTEGCGRHPGQTAAGARLCPVGILVHRCRVVRGRQGGEVEGARGERPRVEGRVRAEPRSRGAAAGPGRHPAVSARGARCGPGVSASAPR
jgi:hypothetical protein